MHCLKCGYEESKVVDSRSIEEGNSIRRRRECLKCAKRYTTYEKIEDFPILVIKKDLTRENFNKEKIINGLIIACQKRPISRKQIEDLAYDIEKTISKYESELSLYPISNSQAILIEGTEVNIATK